MNKNSFPSLQINISTFDCDELDSKAFSPTSTEEKASFLNSISSRPYRQGVLERLKKNKIAMGAFLYILILIIFAFAGPALYPYSYSQQIPGEENTLPFWMGSQNHMHPLGTDNLGRDSLARLMKGTQISLLIGISGSFIVILIGTAYGAIAGFLGGKADFIMMRIVDIIYSVPDILVALFLASILKPRITQIINLNPSSHFSKFFNTLGAPLIAVLITFGSIYWVGMSRVVRGQVLMLKGREFVLAAKILGVSPMRILKKHILPNCMSQIIVTACLYIPAAIFLESFLSFLGIGVSAPLTSLGSMTSDALNEIYSRPYCLLFPTIVLSLLILSLNLLSDGLRDAFDPQTKQ